MHFGTSIRTLAVASNPAGFIIPCVVILAVIFAMAAVRIARAGRKHRFQDDSEHVRTLKIQGQEAAIERLTRAIAEQRRRKRSTRLLRIQLHEAQQRLAALTAD